ncbi:MAG: hypothetical protein Q8Q10_03105 [bacterium]|nr:hypothetical protein [bacterium]
MWEEKGIEIYPFFDNLEGLTMTLLYVLVVLFGVCTFYFLIDGWKDYTKRERLVKIGLIIVAVLVAVLTFKDAPAAETNFWVEPQVIYNKEKSITRLNGGLSGDITDTVGYYAFGLTQSDGYRQLYGGPTWKPLSWFEVGVGMGLESVKPALRRNAYFLATGEKVSLFGTFENGGSGPFRKVVLNYQVSEQVGVGIMEETFLGRGPRVEYTLKKDAALWGALLRDRDSDTTNIVFGVTFNW